MIIMVGALAAAAAPSYSRGEQRWSVTPYTRNLPLLAITWTIVASRRLEAAVLACEDRDVNKVLGAGGAYQAQGGCRWGH